MLVASSACGGGLSAPKAMLADVLFVELDNVALDAGVLEVAGSVANLTENTIWVDPSSWRLELPGATPVGETNVFEIPRHGVAYVTVRFQASNLPSETMLVIGGVRTRPGTAPVVVGAIPLLRGSWPADVATPRGGLPPERPGTDVAKQPSGKELVDRDCGSGPLVTCPR